MCFKGANPVFQDASVLSHSMAPMIRSICIASGRAHTNGEYARKSLVRELILYIDSLIQGLRADDWVYSWQELSGVAWISKLTRDREAELRAMAYLLIERAASDHTKAPLVNLLKVPSILPSSSE